MPASLKRRVFEVAATRGKRPAELVREALLSLVAA